MTKQKLFIQLPPWYVLVMIIIVNVA